MYDFYYTKLLNDSSKFEPRAGNRWVEVWEPDAGGELVLLDGEIAESDISDQIGVHITLPADRALDKNLTKGRLRLQLLIGSPEQHKSDAQILALPISRNTFETIRTTWSLPTELLRMMLSTLPIATEFQTKNSAGQAITGLMVRSARSRDWNFCLGLVYNEETKVVSGIVNGMQADETDLMLKCLRQSTKYLQDPMLLPVFLLEAKVHYFAVLLEKRAQGIENIEYRTGMRHGFSSNPERNAERNREREKLLKELDFDEITQKLTGVTGTLSFCDMTFASSLRALDIVCAVRNRFNSHLNMRLDNAGLNLQNSLDTRISYLRELIVGAQVHGEVLSARTRAQVQTVYSMIGQKDNKLNIETAATSQRIAEIGLFHSNAMKDMAEDSRNVAILTRKDSTDMRIIAVVTLLFLPGTFMATLFSSGFFNFLPGQSNQVVSKWIWLYFALTGGCTFVVFLAWYLSSKRQNKEMLTVMNGDKRPSMPANVPIDSEHGVATMIAPPAIPPFWLERSRSTGDVDPFTSFGSSPDTVK
ncbi:uncharacterized protein Z520_09375 [Fonsecaea multimorphosa CBS 102226]|uniref:Uncharacterized protein n=1 Tax=Fonsecaea multimorphosa CBS 102226 TaxID=1442371 RepID=A0A0D2GZT1_9EURO|nr:uncharacterized protein Z520_09375 [Fonsecaea multimorphosa CBS 102226]KIX95065.1 hypothetical protein Z520_09375 [Fonsecaea multimorphosa CBS 102226]OAL20709.1 hypothetical protein AYO22_08718 [Fonsecaea multimorphosa]